MVFKFFKGLLPLFIEILVFLALIPIVSLLINLAAYFQRQYPDPEPESALK
jgi:hypothetical protein